MKLKVKILTIFLFIMAFSVIFCLSEVIAIGEVSQAWKIVDPKTGETNLIYRTFITAHDSTIANYTNIISSDLVREVMENGTIKQWTYITSNGKEAPSKWVYEDDMVIPGKSQYATHRLVFHDEMFGKYTTVSESDWGYVKPDDGIELDWNISSIQNAVSNSKHILTIPQKSGKGKEIYYITRIGGTYKSTSLGTKLLLTSVYAAQPTIYRYALLNLKNEDKTIYVNDTIIYNKDLENLIKNLNGKTTCYVTAELISKAKDDVSKNGYEVSKTASDFTKQYDKGWSGSSRGEYNDGMGSALNYYDNILKFPQESKRKVYIKHIDIGTGNTIDRTLVDNGQRITPKLAEKYILVGQTKTTSNKSMSGYQEYYEGISIDKSVTKYALNLGSQEKQCLGYNIGIAADRASAQNYVDSLSSRGVFTSGKTAIVAGKNITSNDDAIVIEFYYTSSEKPVEPDVPEDPEPEKDINGNVFVTANMTGNCDDTQQYTITSMPSGISATVGIEGIPQYMAGSVKIDKQEKKHELKVDLTLSVGPHSSRTNYILKYQTDYYNVTNMLIYRFVGNEIYDAGYGYSGTIGDSIFNWTRGILGDTKLVKTPNLKLTGINNKIITNNQSQIQNEKNYVYVSLNTSFGNYDVTAKDNQSISYSYLSTEEWNKVDANGDGYITPYDKTMAENNSWIAYIDKEEALNEYTTARDAVTYYENSYGPIPTTSQVNEAKTRLNSLQAAVTACKTSCTDEIEARDAQEKVYNDLKHKLDTYNYLVELRDEAYDTYNNELKQYNKAVAYEDYLVAHYDSYLALYEEYNRVSSLNEPRIASEFDISATIRVKNMGVTIDGYSLYSQTGISIKNIPFSNNSALLQTHLVTTTKPTVNKSKYNNLTKYITRNEYTNTNKIDEETLNGIRGLAGLVKYQAEVIIGTGSTVQDNTYYSNGTFTVSSSKRITKSYKVNTSTSVSTERYEEVKPVNIYTPITVNTSVVVDKNQVIDQTSGGYTAPLIQLNTPFIVKIGNNKSEGVYGLNNTTAYNMGYFIKFDFDVHKVMIGTKTYKNGEKIPAGTWIGFLTGDNIEVTVQAYGNIEENKLSIISDEKGSYTVRAVAYNSTNIMRNTSKLYPTIDELFDGMHSTVENICTSPNDLPSYFAETTNDVIIINRMYGFRITDVKDIEWKNIFRTTSGNSVNKHTGNLYYAGITKWDTSSTSKVNKITNRTTSEIGRSPLRVLPLGPYKNTDITKIKAPKLGYRFSYDFKVTGSYFDSLGDAKTDKYVKINTKFYYISKDGKTFIEESNGGAGIYLFYKNSNGQYVRIDNNGGNYELKFTPYDGYRYIEDSTSGTLSNTLVSLGNLRSLTLRYNMATPTNNRAAITYYGEYKLPNSTIAVKVDNNGKYNINNPLTDGYIGVVFDIATYAGKVTDNGEEKTVVLRYSQNTQDTPNTSQWDYEGFLGFVNYGNTVKTGEVALKLEKGTWQITNDVYNKIKGTVILYDMDERAASDYE